VGGTRGKGLGFRRKRERKRGVWKRERKRGVWEEEEGATSVAFSPPNSEVQP
jgi:hypothetical protein